MALTAAIIAGAAASVIGAGTGVYSASQAGKAQGAANRNAQQTYEENRRINGQNALQDAINSYRNAQQQALDNRRYGEAKQAEDAQRALVNKLSTATQRDADGNSVEFDPVTGSWRTVNRGIGLDNAERRRNTTSNQYNQSLVSDTVGGRMANDRRVQAGATRSKESELGRALLERYSNHQGRTPQQMEGAGIEKNVAAAMDPLTIGGNMAMLQGYRQGNSGNDALMGSLARQSAGGTRSAIASARYGAPGESLNERDMAAKAILGPATTLNSRASAAPGDAAPVFSGDASSNLLASLSRSNPAGVGTTLNPRNGQNLPVRGNPGTQTPWVPLNASGNAAAGMASSLSSLATDKSFFDNVQRLFTKAPSAQQPYAPNAPAGYTDRGFQAGDYPSFG